MAGPKVIKRYANRKLYDTEKSCYVTLDEIARMVKEGTDVKVIDNQTKEDLTSITLAQILFEEEKKRKSVLPLTTLVGLLRTGQSAVSDLLDKTSKGARDIKEGAGRKVEKIETMIRGAGETAEERKRALGEMLEGMHRSIEETQKHVDDRIKQAVSKVVPVPLLREELKRLKGKVQELEDKIGSLE